MAVGDRGRGGGKERLCQWIGGRAEEREETGEPESKRKR